MTTSQFVFLSQIMQRKEERIRIGTFNILFDLYDHHLPVEYRWPERKSRVVEMIRHLKPDLLGLQEVYPNQLQDLLVGLDEDYAFTGLPEEDGEHNGIFYLRNRFTLISTHYENHLNSAVLKDQTTDKMFIFCNTHLNFFDPDKREFQALRIHEFMKQHASDTLILTGDMNTFSNYPYLTKLPFYDGHYIETILKGDLLIDAREEALLGHVGPLSTFSNDGKDPAPFKGTGTPGIFLDHIFVSKNIKVLVHGIDPGLVNGLFPSDHLPVFSDVLIN